MLVMEAVRKAQRRADKKLKLEDPKIEQRRKLRSLLRSMVPFRYLIENSRAIFIQRIWRGHKGRKGAFRRRINSKLQQISNLHKLCKKAATNIQKS